ncbi:MAG: hypothetical protein COZ06_28595 [Armatimonadetes bacterium CG_4_10_14_3_um_filter_66_18]|nr:hypothetical protein [Armatimonadota bacterium]OIO93817.1 MAG: hypothetical protein AUJ96_29650 [Armatimonadetes bacterium CG2_30_66_41]PIU92761.1 MAG: hypothetical protein COS65_16040 [Armatimonadetes bacterium CG06_land_8_20_14_3_00_66_21]PIX44732.1 MAG: hypothetical protein COZ57_16945 [Armatimonadetes bacterium CG_4_8_14_3_um_filter_66_20]PIY40116.1 MAG: hypothetical protein COZ06_28595 [Armatimonadetes bacterium CG_4_10_14_3_um_filter_66_18]PIZ41712.1 MAG: hypothetical protein COY42_18
MSETITIPPITSEYLTDMNWALAHSQELHDRYENEWVAIVGGEVVAAGPDPARVKATAAERCNRDAEEIFLDYVEDGAAVYGLWHQ